MKKDKTDEKCLRCRYCEPGKEFTLVLNEQARWVAGIHCTNKEMYKDPYVIPSTKGMKCKMFNEGVKR